MSTTHAEPAAPVPVTRVPRQIQRCGGTTCPPGTCDHDEEVQRHADGPGLATVPATVLGVLGTPGTPLDAASRTSMEGRFRQDFGRVRIHTDADAARSAAEIQASAYTYGRHVVMGADCYEPRSAEGQRLLAHELTHVTQQGEQAGRPTSISDPHDPAELAAERAAQTEVPAPRTRSPATGGQPRSIARQPADASGAALVRVDCGTMLVEFSTDAGSASFPLTTCRLAPGTYAAVAQTEGDDIHIVLTDAPSLDQATFSYQVGPGERGPTALFRASNERVTVVVTGTQPATPDETADTASYPELFELMFAEGTRTTSSNGPVPAPTGSTPASFLSPDASYALAVTPGFVAGGGYSPPAGLLAAESLPAASQAEALLTAQGLATEGTALVEGAELAESLTAAGEAILVVEAAGAGEVEAAIPVAGWIVGAVVLAAAGGLILAGYLLRRPREEASPGTQAVPRSKTGDCTQERHDTLQSEVDEQCKRLPRACDPGMGKAELKRNAFRNWRCARARDLLNDECFGGGDEGHKRAAQLAWEAYERCWDLYRKADRLP